MTAHARYARGVAVIPSARDRRIARRLDAEALEQALTTSLAEALATHIANGPTPDDDDGEGLVDVADDELLVDALTPEEYSALDDFQAADARDRATYAEVADTTAFMRAYLQRAGLSAAPDVDVARCVDCEVPTAHRTRNGLCADCALAHLEGVALSHLEAS